MNGDQDQHKVLTRTTNRPELGPKKVILQFPNPTRSSHKAWGVGVVEPIGSNIV
jgi:hypothetical protein